MQKCGDLLRHRRRTPRRDEPAAGHLLYLRKGTLGSTLNIMLEGNSCQQGNSTCVCGMKMEKCRSPRAPTEAWEAPGEVAGVWLILFLEGCQSWPQPPFRRPEPPACARRSAPPGAGSLRCRYWPGRSSRASPAPRAIDGIGDVAFVRHRHAPADANDRSLRHAAQ